MTGNKTHEESTSQDTALHLSLNTNRGVNETKKNLKVYKTSSLVNLVVLY